MYCCCYIYCCEVLKGGGFESLFIPVLSFNYTDSKTNGLIDAITSPLRYSGVYLFFYCRLTVLFVV